MKIAILGIRGLPANYGGFETCAEHTSKHWINQGHKVLVYCRKSHYNTSPKEINGVELVYIKSLNLKGFDTLMHTLFSIFNLIFKHSDYKHIHLYNSGNGIFIPLLRLFKKKVIVSVDGIEWKRDKWGFLAKTTHKVGAYFSVKFANKVITDNKKVYDYYKNIFGIDSSIIAYGAKFIDNENLSKKYLRKHGLTKGEYYIFVGRLVPEKGTHHLIEAYLKLKTKKPLVIIGNDTKETAYTRNLFQKYNNDDRIIMTGFLYNEEYEELLVNAYLYLSASELEGTSPSLLAAMGAGVCTLVNGIDENLETIQDSGFAFEKCNYNDLFRKWQDCENSPLKVKEMAVKGSNHVKKKYRWEKISQRYIKLFQSIK